MLELIETVKQDWGSRPWWMNLMFYFCLYMTFIYMPFDFFLKPVAEDQEVWFGILLTGWWAKATEPLHWLIYGAGAYGFAMAYNYNGRLRPAEVLVDGAEVRVVRRRERYEDLIRGEEEEA